MLLWGSTVIKAKITCTASSHLKLTCVAIVTFPNLIYVFTSFNGPLISQISLTCFLQSCKKHVRRWVPGQHDEMTQIFKIKLNWLEQYCHISNNRYTQWTIKKRDILFLTITLANLNRFLSFLYHFNREETLHASIIKFITSPDLCAHLTWEKLKPTFLPWFIKRSSVHLTATLSNLNRF